MLAWNEKKPTTLSCLYRRTRAQARGCGASAPPDDDVQAVSVCVTGGRLDLGRELGGALCGAVAKLPDVRRGQRPVAHRLKEGGQRAVGPCHGRAERVGQDLFLVRRVGQQRTGRPDRGGVRGAREVSDGRRDRRPSYVRGCPYSSRRAYVAATGKAPRASAIVAVGATTTSRRSAS